MLEVLHGSPVFIRQAIAQGAKLHESNLFMAILTGRRGSQPINILCSYLPEDILISICASVMSLIHDYHSIVGYSLIHGLITAQ